MKSNKTCKYCADLLENDWIALNKKMLNPNVEEYACLSCLADDFECSVEDLKVKIEEFKENGCTLFK